MQALRRRPILDASVHRQPNRRGAFSLIELVVVIMIIAILSGLLLTGVQSAVNRARVTAVAVDIKNLEQGIKEFQAKFGVTEAPPSRIVLYEDYGDWPDISMSMDVAERRNAAAIRRLWPSFLDNTGRPAAGSGWSENLNGDTDETDTFELTGPECLAFFLGGVFTKTSATAAEHIPNGFSSNPLNPFATGGTRIGPFTELNPARLLDTDGNGYPEYMDAFPSSTNPYLYLSAYGGRGYRPLGDGSPPTRDASASVTGAAKDEIPFAISATFDKIYTQSATGATPVVAWNPKTYQIISAGLSKEWGSVVGGTAGGGHWDSENGVDATRKEKERDNLTNFSGGELQ
jgi:prepilin-type N-terminal cleavage/methylation domain-containing protein